MTVMEEDRHRANKKREKVALTETDDLEAMSSWSQPVLMKESLVAQLPTPIPNGNHHTLAQGLEVLSDASDADSCRNDDFERTKEEQERLPEEVKARKMEKQNLRRRHWRRR